MLSVALRVFPSSFTFERVGRIIDFSLNNKQMLCVRALGKKNKNKKPRTIVNGIVSTRLIFFMLFSFFSFRDGSCLLRDCQLGIRNQRYHLLSGSVLLIWPQLEAALKEFSNGKMQVCDFLFHV